MSQNIKFTQISGKKRIWAIGAVHGEDDKLKQLHGQIANYFVPGDCLIYMGNLMGRGPNVAETLNEVLSFRRLVILQEGADLQDVVFLRGAQEEMIYKLRQLPYAQEPGQVLQWMANQGVDRTLAIYKTSCQEGMEAARLGLTGVSKWVSKLRSEMHQHDGHEQYMDALKRAAFRDDHKLLFVNANVDPQKPLDAQNDAFWWGTYDFRDLDYPFGDFDKTVRGFDHRQQGYYDAPHHLCIDGACGFGGELHAVCFDEDAQQIHHLTA